MRSARTISADGSGLRRALAHDTHLGANEPERLERLKSLGGR
jgi:hypothetical protein